MKSLRVVFGSLAILFIATAAGCAEGTDVRPELKINREKADRCVEPTDVMRRDHMKFLLHQRDETVHKGIRTKKYSLKECVDCHANKDESGQYLSVNAPGEFCQACHAYASVSIDCFQCHATKPKQTAVFHPIVNEKMRTFKETHDNSTGKLLDGLLAKKRPTGTER